eukprot:1530233-Rhodomonas_salina.4
MGLRAATKQVLLWELPPVVSSAIAYAAMLPAYATPPCLPMQFRCQPTRFRYLHTQLFYLHTHGLGDVRY